MAGYHNPQYYVGDVRPSQLLTSFGVGAIIKLPYLSTLVMGLGDWNTQGTTAIEEPRLLQAIQSVFPRVHDLLMPPVEEGNSQNIFSKIGVPVATFPRWMVCPFCRLLAPVESGIFQLQANSRKPDKTCYRHTNCEKAKNPIVVPSRFLIACEAGHLDDFPWHHFLHGGKTCRAELYMRERGVSGEPSDIVITCATCKARRSMSDAFTGEENLERAYKPDCSGRSPHLRTFRKRPCPHRARTTLLSASNTWFPLIYTSLAIPEGENTLDQLVESEWNNLQVADALPTLSIILKLPMLAAKFSEFSAESIWEAIERKRNGGTIATRAVKPGELKFPEWRVLIDPLNAPPHDDFKPVPGDVPDGYTDVIQQVVLVERLREVRALTGFTRIESLSDYAEDKDLPTEHIMRLTNGPLTWLPATEVRGEGIFIQFREDVIQQWTQRPAIRQHNLRFYDAHRRWRREHKISDEDANYPDIRYILLHTFAHALIRQLTLECGYAAASIRERIYAQPPEAEGGPMAGILLYTADADSEGTLGGLVSQGNQLGFHIGGVCDDMEYCTSDPLCAEHVTLEGSKLHGAACHSCMFIPETSCERGNRYLDRSLLMPTVERDDLAFFEKRETTQ